MAEVEAIINSTPMTTPSGNLNDFEVLTRNFILTKKSGVILPQFGAFQSADIYFRKIWRRVLYAATVFWTRWSGEYPSTLPKWNLSHRSMAQCDIVIIKDSSFPRNRSLRGVSLRQRLIEKVSSAV